MTDNIPATDEGASHEHSKYNLQRATILSWFNPIVLVLCGLMAFVPYSLTESLVLRGVQVLVFFVCASQVKHVKIWYFIMVTTTVMLFHLLVPNGKVLWEYGPLRITEGALQEGLFRGLTLNGYVFLSLWCISHNLSLPTKYGRLLSLSVRYFTIIVSTSADKKYRSFVKAERHQSDMQDDENGPNYEGEQNKQQDSLDSAQNNKQQKKQKIWSRFRISDKLALQTDRLLTEVIAQIDKESAVQHNTQRVSTCQQPSMYQKTIGVLCLVLSIVVAWIGVFVE